MKSHPTSCVRPIWALLLLGTAICAQPAAAADQSGQADAQAIYLRDIDACKHIPAGSDTQACLREAGAARANKGALDKGRDAGDFKRNALKRCAPLPEVEQRDCVARLEGAGTISGSVAEGGILRELVTQEAAPPTVIPAKPLAATVPQ